MHTLVALLDSTLGQVLGLERLVRRLGRAPMVVLFSWRHIAALSTSLESEWYLGRQIWCLECIRNDFALLENYDCELRTFSTRSKAVNYRNLGGCGTKVLS